MLEPSDGVNENTAYPCKIGKPQCEMLDRCSNLYAIEQVFYQCCTLAYSKTRLPTEIQFALSSRSEKNVKGFFCVRA